MTELGDAGYTYTARLPRRRRGRWELSVVRTGPDGAARNLTRMTDISASDSQPGRGKRLAVAATEEWVQELRSAQERERAERARSEGIMALDAERAGRLLMPLEEYGRLFNQRRVRRSEIELSTATNWEADFRRYCVSALPQGLRVCDVTPDHVTEMIGVVIGDRGLSTDSARKGLFALSQVMREAVAHDGLPTNPCEGIRPPRQGVPRKNPLSVRSAKETLDQLMGLQMTPAVFGACCAILFGVAEGEICGLPLSLCDLDDTRSIYIRYAVGRNGSAFYLKEPKNRHRIRRIYLTDLMVDLFRMREAAMRRECDLAGTRLTDKHYLVGPARGGFLTPNTLGKQWKTLSESLDLVGMEAKRVTFHDLRHTFATTANAAGIDLPTIAHIMGHSTTYVTSLVYVSVDPDEAAGALLRLEQKLGLAPLDVGCGMTRGELRGAARAVFGFPEAA